MSYRLIDSNAIAMSHPEVNDMPCIYADLPNGLDGGCYDMADCEEIVRCRDCAYFDTRKCKSQWPFCLDAFCWWGKRKEGSE